VIGAVRFFTVACCRAPPDVRTAAAPTCGSRSRRAEAQVSRLVEKAAGGAEIVIAKAGVPKARLVPLARPVPPRAPGAWKGRVVMVPNFDAPLPEDVLAAFEGRR